MEMDEIISQLQQWRLNSVTHDNGIDDGETSAELAGSTYHSEAYDRLFKSDGGPESDAPVSLLAEKKYTADDEMIAKVNIHKCSLQHFGSVDLGTTDLYSFLSSLFHCKPSYGKVKAALRLQPTENMF